MGQAQSVMSEQAIGTQIEWIFARHSAGGHHETPVSDAAPGGAGGDDRLAQLHSNLAELEARLTNAFPPSPLICPLDSKKSLCGAGDAAGRG